VAALVSVAFLLYKNELGRACEAARRGSLVANTDAGPIEYAQKGAGIPLVSIHGAGGGFDQGLANAAEFVDEGFRIIAPSRSGRVEDGRGSLGPMANAPFPIPAHQTGRADFRHPAFRLASPQGTRRQTNRTRLRHGE
jgi:hypothetical protein